METGLGFESTWRTASQTESKNNRRERNIDEWSGSYAPQGGAGPGWRIHKGHATERPEHDAVCDSANLTAGERVAELVEQHDQEKAQILDQVPGNRGVASEASPHLKERDQEPRPVEEDGYAREAKEAN